MDFYSSTVHKTNSASPECAICSLREREQEKKGNKRNKQTVQKQHLLIFVRPFEVTTSP